MNPETILLGKRDSLGSLLGQYGADFYTDIYHMTYQVGFEVQKAYVNICNAIGWLIVAIGLVDVACFSYKMASCGENYSGNNYNAAPIYTAQDKKITQSVPVSTPAPKKEVVAPAQSAMHSWRCDNCGQMISKSPCEHCGYSTSKSDAPYWCGNCGHSGPYEGNCPKCNSSLKRFNVSGK